MKHKVNIVPCIGAGLLAVFLFLFRIPISTLLNLIFVAPIFSSFERGLWVDVVLALILLLSVFWLAKEQKWEFLLKVAFYGLVFYVFQRVNNYWEFTPMMILPKLAYWDLIAFALFLISPISYLFQGKSVDSGVEESQRGFIEDNAATKLADDQFKRNVAATEIARIIKLTNNQKSFAIGILGDYGSGKTSFLNLINLNIEDTKVIKIAFDPWSAGNPETIRREFFDLLASEIAAFDSKISSLIYSYGRKLSSFDTRSLSWLNWFGFLKNKGSSQSAGEHQQINDMLQATNRKIVITIDDLDRLYPAEIVEVLKLIRNTADFSNVVYLVGYDKAYVQGAIKSLNETGSLNYLDKIFQLEIPLPKREEDDLLNTLRTHLKEIISVEHSTVFENVMIPNGFRNRYEKAYKGILRQGRDVVRFINSFKIAYSLIGEEVDFQCLLLLELIKFRFPSIYDLIYTQSDTFLYENPVRSTHELYYLPCIEKDLQKKSDEVSVFKSHIEKLGWLSAEDVSLLDGLFTTLFNGNRFHHPNSRNSISYPLYFEIYFRYRLSQKDLSDKDFKAAMVSGNMRKYMEYCASHDLHKELMTRLMQEDISNDKYHFNQVIGWIFSFGRTFVEKEGMFRVDYTAIIDKIYNYHNTITNKLYKNDTKAYKDFVNLWFNAAQAPFLFENELIYHLKKKGDDFVVPTSELIEHQLSYFTRYAETSHGLSETTLWLFWGAREHYKIPAESPGDYYEQWQFEPELVTKMKLYLLSKDPKEFLKFSIQHDLREPSLAFIYKQVLDMFDDLSEYRALVANNEFLIEDIKLEYLELFDKCAKTDFKSYVEMEFKSELQKAQ